MLGVSRVMDVTTGGWNVVGIGCIPFVQNQHHSYGFGGLDNYDLLYRLVTCLNTHLM